MWYQASCMVPYANDAAIDVDHNIVVWIEALTVTSDAKAIYKKPK